MAPADDKPVDHHDDDDSDSDAPEEVGKAASKSSALAVIEKEQAAANAATEASKTKRRQEIERNTKQQQSKRSKTLELATIPFDLLAKVAAARKGTDNQDDDATEDDESDSEANQKSTQTKQPNKRIIFSKQLKTKSTYFEALNRNTELGVVSKKARANVKSCFKFRDQMLYGTRRINRTRTSKISANCVKRAVRW